MGTSGHSADLAMILPPICEVMDVVPGMQFEVFGTIKMPSQMERFGRRVRHIEAVGDYGQFLTHLRTLGWWIGLAPLEDNPFNRSKADTKWVEYSSAGIPVIASDLPLYERACAEGAGILANSKEDWKKALIELVYRPDLRKRMVERAQARLQEIYTHECLRAQVAEIFSRALTMKPQASRKAP
jgi:glycosyltransferase involved in cell wall biosynthesis